MAAPPSIDVVVSLAESHRSRMADVVTALRAAGLTVTRQLASLGQVTGSIQPDRLSDLKRVAGVAYVEQSGEYRAL